MAANWHLEQHNLYKSGRNKLWSQTEVFSVYNRLWHHSTLALQCLSQFVDGAFVNAHGQRPKLYRKRRKWSAAPARGGPNPHMVPLRASVMQQTTCLTWVCVSERATIDIKQVVCSNSTETKLQDIQRHSKSAQHSKTVGISVRSDVFLTTALPEFNTEHKTLFLQSHKVFQSREVISSCLTIVSSCFF